MAQNENSLSHPLASPSCPRSERCPARVRTAAQTPAPAAPPPQATHRCRGTPAAQQCGPQVERAHSGGQSVSLKGVDGSGPAADRWTSWLNILGCTSLAVQAAAGLHQPSFLQACLAFNGRPPRLRHPLIPPPLQHPPHTCVSPLLPCCSTHHSFMPCSSAQPIQGVSW